MLAFRLNDHTKTAQELRKLDDFLVIKHVLSMSNIQYTECKHHIITTKSTNIQTPTKNSPMPLCLFWSLKESSEKGGRRFRSIASDSSSRTP